jgi:hypothetical protein
VEAVAVHHHYVWPLHDLSFGEQGGGGGGWMVSGRCAVRNGMEDIVPPVHEGSWPALKLCRCFSFGVLADEILILTFSWAVTASDQLDIF